MWDASNIVSPCVTSRYVISVRAFTRVGGGPGQEVVAQTEEGGEDDVNLGSKSLSSHAAMGNACERSGTQARMTWRVHMALCRGFVEATRFCAEFV